VRVGAYLKKATKTVGNNIFRRRSARLAASNEERREYGSPCESHSLTSKLTCTGRRRGNHEGKDSDGTQAGQKRSGSSLRDGASDHRKESSRNARGSRCQVERHVSRLDLFDISLDKHASNMSPLLRSAESLEPMRCQYTSDRAGAAQKHCLMGRPSWEAWERVRHISIGHLNIDRWWITCIGGSLYPCISSQNIRGNRPQNPLIDRI